jgi:hypothetical protein
MPAKPIMGVDQVLGQHLHRELVRVLGKVIAERSRLLPCELFH